MRFEGINDGSGRYYEPIDTCLRCDKCGKKEYVKGYSTLVKEKITNYDTKYEDTIDRSTGRVVDRRQVSQQYAGSTYRYIDINIQEDGYRHTYYPYGKKHNWCKACVKKRRKKITIFTALIIIAILLIALLQPILVGLLSGRAVQEQIFEKSVVKYEAQSDNIDMPDGSTVLRDAIPAEISGTDNYIMKICNSDISVIQKCTVLDKATYYFDFKGSEYAELDGKKYIFDGDIIYELGQENKAYYASSAEYSPLLEKLKGFYAEKICAQGTYTKEVSCVDEDGADVNLIYGDGVTILNYSGGYYEKTADRFIWIKYGEYSKIADIPKAGDFTEIK